MNNLEQLCSGMFSDELDKMGYRNQVISGMQLNCFESKCYGQVRTVQIETIETDDENIHVGLGFLEKLEPGQILCVEGSHDFAYFGELMSRLSIRQKIGGVIIGGLSRDSFFTKTLKSLPIFVEGYSPKDIKGRGRVKATDVQITIGNLKIQSGDWVFADHDGIVVIPAKLKAELQTRVERLIKEEKDILNKIDSGKSVAEILTKHSEF